MAVVAEIYMEADFNIANHFNERRYVAHGIKGKSAIIQRKICSSGLKYMILYWEKINT